MSGSAQDLNNRPWFAVSCLFKSTVGSQSGLFEESIVLVSAADSDEASEKAILGFAGNASEFLNEAGELVVWSFDEILCVYPLVEHQVGDCTEVFSRFLDEAQVNALKHPNEV